MKSPWVYVVFYLVKGKIVAAYAIETRSIAVSSIVKNTALINKVEYDDYTLAFIHA